MKIFKYSKLLFIIQLIFSLLCSFLLINGVNFLFETIFFSKKSIMIIAVFMLLLSPFTIEYFNRYVEFKDDYAVFNSFRIDGKVRNYNVKYENILSLEATKIPLLGIYKVKVNAKNVPYAIPVTWCMKKRKDLFSNLCYYSKKHNPKVFIDEHLTELLKKEDNYDSPENSNE